MDTNTTWAKALRAVLQVGEHISPRGQETAEVLGYQTIVNMSQPVVTVPSRKLSRKFLVAEAAWILCGSDKVEDIAPYNKNIAQFSDDGVTFFGAYGPKFIDQVHHVIYALSHDRDSRQAVITFWRESPPSTKDVPCTLSIQFLIRGDRLEAIVNMRSSDLWLGWVYDVFNFSMMAAFVALQLKASCGIVLRLGDLRLTAGSQHIYQRDWEKAQVAASEGLFSTHMLPSIRPIHLSEFNHPFELVAHLVALRDGTQTSKSWLEEVFRA